MVMCPETRWVLKAVRDNGFRVDTADGGGVVHVRVLDPHRNAETAYTFDPASELEVRRAIAETFCSDHQREAAGAAAEFGQAGQGPYRYVLA